MAQLTIMDAIVLNQGVKAESIKGVLEKIRFASEDGEFAVAVVQAAGLGPVNVVGNLLACKVGESVEIDGSWQNNAKFGRQFAIERIRSVAPTTLAGIERYLASGLIEGVGAVLAERIVAHFGAETLDIIDRDPSRIREVPGIGKKRAESIEAAWGEQRLIRHVMVFLQSHGVTTTYAARIWKRYGAQAIETIHKNPYRLSEDIFGIGFQKADDIAISLGLRHDSVQRMAAGARYVLRQAGNQGHVFLPLSDLLERAQQLLGLPANQIGSAIESLRRDQKVFIESVDGMTAVYDVKSWRAETDVAAGLGRLRGTPRHFQVRSVAHKIDEIETKLHIQLAAAQRKAVEAVFESKISVITGGPGTGKTTIIQTIDQLAKELGQKVGLAAPTGRAAKRLSEATGDTARTIHRLLEFQPREMGFQFNRDNPLDLDLLIVDEASMIDVFLMRSLVDALPDEAALLLVGDIDQLPSVGAGNVLRDIINSDAATVVALDEVFRQAAESTIVANAHRINQGQMPLTPDRGGELADFYTINAQTPAQAADRIVQMVTERIPNAFGLDPFEDVQVLCPMRRGEAGTDAMNARLRDALNPDGLEYKRGDTTWREGDKVMQIRNNYDKEIFNGDIGRIERIDRFNKRIHARFDGRLISYEFNDLDELRHAYAITIHKSQGSEYRAVVVPMLTQHYIMLQRNLLYTAVTRARELAIIIGSSKAVSLAVKNADASDRFTLLAHRLKNCP